MDYKPDFKKAYIKANELLVSSALFSDFPVDIFAVIEELSDIEVVTYEKILERGFDMRLLGSDDAEIVEDKGRYLIAYNTKFPKERQQFSITHEFAHYQCEHKFLDWHADCNNPLYIKEELEANFFAAQILMPEQIIREFIKREKNINEAFLMKTFGVSMQAAEKRLKTLRKINSSQLSPEQRIFDDIIVKQAQKFIDRIAPKWAFYDIEEELEKQQERDSWL